MTAILVLDVGTSATKAVLFDPDGSVLQEASAEIPTDTASGRQEQDAEDWWRAVQDAVAALDIADLAAVSLAGTMQNTLALDADGAPLAPAILYSDARAGEEHARLKPALDALGAGPLIGNDPDPSLTLFKTVWLRDHAPDIFARTAMLVSGAKDYVANKLTGARTTDPTQATTTGLMDIVTRDWSQPVLDAAGLDRALLPGIVAADAIIGTVMPGLGLPEGTPVVNGCGDAGAATLGAGVSEAGQAYVYLGTTGWVARVVPIDGPRDPLPVYTLAHPFPGQAIEIAAILSAGDCVDWLRDALGDVDLETLEAGAQAVDANPPDALFLPYLKGERNPFHDDAVRGAFLGLDRGDGASVLFYAVLEGVALAIRHNLEALGAAPAELGLLGGGGESALWPQLIADATGLPVRPAELPTAATAFGALRLATRALGLPDPVARAQGRAIEPRADLVARADARFRRFLSATAFAREFRGR